MSPSLPGMATFMTAESGATFWNNYSVTEWIQVQYNSNPAAMGAMQVYIDHDAADDTQRYLVNSGGQNFIIATSSGRLIHIKHDSNAASNGVPLYFDMQAASPRTRVIADSPNDVSITTKTSTDHSWLFKAPHA